MILHPSDDPQVLRRSFNERLAIACYNVIPSNKVMHGSSPTSNSRSLLIRRRFCGSIAGSMATGLAGGWPQTVSGSQVNLNDATKAARQRGLKWLAQQQSRLGSWSANGSYPVALTALAGLAFSSGGSTPTQGPFSKQIRQAVDFLLSKSRTNGLIGDPDTDDRYTYGHGFGMLFLSQILGEESNRNQRTSLKKVLAKAIQFSFNAQTKAGGWGYVSAKEGNQFDEGSTTVTQVQGLRSCRNAGLSVPQKCIEDAIKYIYRCKNKDGGISYSSDSENKGLSRPAITAAALASLFDAGDLDSKHVPQMWKYCKQQLHSLADDHAWGNWHYTYLYYSQVVYRHSKTEWEPYRDRLYRKLIAAQKADGGWEGEVAPVYVTCCCLIMLNLDLGYLPIFQRLSKKIQ